MTNLGPVQCHFEDAQGGFGPPQARQLHCELAQDPHLLLIRHTISLSRPLHQTE